MGAAEPRLGDLAQSSPLTHGSGEAPNIRLRMPAGAVLGEWLLGDFRFLKETCSALSDQGECRQAAEGPQPLGAPGASPRNLHHQAVCLQTLRQQAHRPDLRFAAYGPQVTEPRTGPLGSQQPVCGVGDRREGWAGAPEHMDTCPP